MNIGIVCYPTFGGSGVIATELGRLLASQGHQVHFITYDRPVRLDFFVQNVFYHEVITPNYPLFQYLPYESALTSKIIDVSLKYSLDILHVHYAIPHASAAVFAKQILKTHGFHLPVVTTLHGTDITLVGKEETYFPVIKYAIEESDGVTAVSHYLEQATHHTFQIQRPIEVIHNFVSLERFHPKPEVKSLYKKMIAPNNQRILVHVSNFRKVKRVFDVYEIFVRVNEAISCKLVMVGDGPERAPLEKLVREQNHQQQVIFMGKQERIEDILSVSDVFLLPSETESFGLAALEAMACGLPVVASHTGGIPEIVLHNYNGFTAQTGDTEQMASYTLNLLSNCNLYQTFAQNALLTAQKFEDNQVVNLYEKFYQTICNSQKNAKFAS